MRSGKTYYQIVEVIKEAMKKNNDPPTIVVPSEAIRKRVEDIARSLGVNLEIRYVLLEEKEGKG